MLWSGTEIRPDRFLFVARRGLLKPGEEKAGKMELIKVEYVDHSIQYAGFTIHPDGHFYTNDFKKRLLILDPDQQYKTISDMPFPYHVNTRHWIEGSEDYLIGSRNGLYKFNASKEAVEPIDFCKCGINASVQGIFSLGGDNYFIAGESGCCTVDLISKQSIIYGKEHGLGLAKIGEGCAIRLNNGKILLSGAPGIAVFHPDSLLKPTFHYQVNFARILINDETRIIDKLNYTLDGFTDLHLKFAENTVSFEFAAMSYTGIGDQEYEYKLSGLENKWVDGGKRGFARYSNLAPGKYTFSARVKGQDLSYRSLHLQIFAPLYARLWFQLILGCLIAALIYILARQRAQRKQMMRELRLKQLLALEQERVRIATDMHDEIGSGLSGLTMHAEFLVQETEDTKLRNQLSQLAQSGRNLTQKVREIIWTVNAKNDTIENLVSGIHQYGVEYFRHTAIRCTFIMDTLETDLKMPGYHRREIFLSLKEALHNVIKHANASKVMISATFEAKHLLIKVEDNGTGFDLMPTNIAGNGITSMQKRMERVNGSFNIHTDPQGTKVSLSYPLPEKNGAMSNNSDKP